MKERGISVRPTTILHVVHEYGNFIYQIWKNNIAKVHLAAFFCEISQNNAIFFYFLNNEKVY